MIFIAHRGNLINKNLQTENTPEQIELCINNGYDVEIDIYIINNSLYLGHDKPETMISYSWLESIKKYLWIHCKNFDAVQYMYNTEYNYFWHNTDDYTITSKGYIWTYPGKPFNQSCVLVCPERWTSETQLNCTGICSDNISLFRSQIL
jgi:hypothetical protein